LPFARSLEAQVSCQAAKRRKLLEGKLYGSVSIFEQALNVEEVNVAFDSQSYAAWTHVKHLF